MEAHENQDDDDMDAERQQHLNDVAKIAVEIEKETQVPAQLLIAQWALESHWGSEPVGKNNYFGMKKAERHASGSVCGTTEIMNGKTVKTDCEFADYDSLEASCRDYAWLISNAAPYATAWKKFLHDHKILGVQGLLYNIAHTYATNPHYYMLVSQIAQQANVIDAINHARQA